MILRDVNDSEGTRYLGASLTPDGDLVIEGHDYGDGVERIFGYREYEWIWTIRSRDVPILLEALNTSSDLLSALGERFKGERAADLKSFLDSHDVPYEAWSRIGD